MKEKIKEFLISSLGIGFSVLIIIAFGLLIIGGTKLFELLYPTLERISHFTWGIIFLLLLPSIVPKFRKFTGSGIVIGSYINGAIFWFICFYVTYYLWGLVGTFIGVFLLGFGTFLTAILALLFKGQFTTALSSLFTLLLLGLFRFLGFWIITKYKPKQEKDILETIKDYLKVKRSLTQMLGREPLPEEIAKEMNKDTEEILHLIRIYSSLHDVEESEDSGEVSEL